MPDPIAAACTIAALGLVLLVVLAWAACRWSGHCADKEDQ